ncbi:MAG: pyridoxamine 5'-phosphate oxidase family protein [Candidatus Korarchaeum sp.]|nr:pyridoxamine 5'-phosphate oxidase family protein [Candidatus Korarchaeum sp.]MDW8036311.1 pyridoxamine 5'-phosphate oxidase family protein [Candidatus Korarchaeum sp.]
MRRKDKEITDIREIEEVIKRAKVCRLAMCDGAIPYCIPMSFGYRDGKIYVHSAREGRKLEVLRTNNVVCFELDIDVELIRRGKPCNWTMSYKSVVGLAEAHFVTDKEEKREALNCIMEHYSGESYDFSDEELERVEVIRLDVREIRGKRSP